MAAPRLTIDDLPEDTTVTGTEVLIVSDAGASKKLVLNNVLAIPTTALDAHITATIDAHDASAISAAVTNAAITGTDVQSQLQQLAANQGNTQSQAQANTDAINAHLAGTSDAHDASAVSALNGTLIVGADVQSQLTAIDVYFGTVDASMDADAAALSTHIQASGAHPANNISITVITGFLAANVQSILEEMAARIIALENQVVALGGA